MGEVVRLPPPRSRKRGSLTKRQLMVLNYMTAYEASKQAWPTKAEIRAALNIRPRLGADFLLGQLVRMGAIPTDATSPTPNTEA